MFDFKYFTPTKVIFGKDTEGRVAELIKEFGGTKVLIHYGGGSVERDLRQLLPGGGGHPVFPAGRSAAQSPQRAGV